MPKKKTSINLDEEFWKKWTLYVHIKTGSSYRTSEVTQEALEEYMKNHPLK
jgi:hypothetical protein